MAVRCEGDCKIMEQLGEKQDFECALSRLGFAHEAFSIHVRSAPARGGGTNWLARYAVRITNAVTKRSQIYWGGGAEQWVVEFVADVARGVYGSPDLNRAAPGPLHRARPRLVSRGPTNP